MVVVVLLVALIVGQGALVGAILLLAHRLKETGQMSSLIAKQQADLIKALTVIKHLLSTDDRR